VYLDESITSNNILIVHLPGSYGNPNKAQLFGTLAAELGFHSIGLSYPNTPTVSSICSNSSDLSCYENVRREIITGTDLSTEVSVDTTECIFNRIKKILIYLKTNYPSENWAQYLDVNNDLIYSKIIFSGHSQGGGHAALIAKDYAIKRAICLSAPKDYSSYFDTPASWIYSTNWQTAKNKIYTFEHTLDNYTEQLEILDSLGLNIYGLPVDEDNNSSPYNNTLQLITSYSVPSGNEHGCTVVDNKTPLNSGTPVFLPVWTYMLTNDITLGSPLLVTVKLLILKVFPNPTTSTEPTPERSSKASTFKPSLSTFTSTSGATSSFKTQILPLTTPSLPIHFHSPSFSTPIPSFFSA